MNKRKVARAGFVTDVGAPCLKIGKTAARKKAAKYTGIKLSTIKKGTCYYDYDDDDRVGKYEIKFTKGNYKYDLEILAATGKVIDYEKELINR